MDLLQPELNVHINYHGIRISIFGTQKIPGKDGKGENRTNYRDLQGKYILLYTTFSGGECFMTQELTMSNVKYQRYDFS